MKERRVCVSAKLEGFKDFFFFCVFFFQAPAPNKFFFHSFFSPTSSLLHERKNVHEAFPSQKTHTCVMTHLSHHTLSTPLINPSHVSLDESTTEQNKLLAMLPSATMVVKTVAKTEAL